VKAIALRNLETIGSHTNAENKRTFNVVVVLGVVGIGFICLTGRCH